LIYFTVEDPCDYFKGNNMSCYSACLLTILWIISSGVTKVTTLI